MFKKICAAVAVLGAVYSVVAQNVEGVNARIDAMGGFGVPSDIGWTIDQPCKLYGYPDQVQTNGIIKDIEGIGKSYGSIIMTKSIGPRFFIGLTFNDRRAMFGKFYTIAQEFGGFTENFAAMQMGKWLPNWPHLTFCIKPSDKLSLGIGTYLEYSKYDAEHTKELKYFYLNNNNVLDTAKVGYDSTTARKYYGIGIIADALIWFGPVKVNPQFKLFIPKLDGKNEMNLGEKIDTTLNVTQNLSVINYRDIANTTDFSKNLYLRAGAKVSGTISKTFCILGLWYKTERFELERSLTKDSTILVPNDTPVTIHSQIAATTHAFNNSSYDWWLGFQPSYIENTIFGAEYAGAVQVLNINPPKNKTADSTLIVVKHKIRLGVEGKVPIRLYDIWDLNFLPRAGLIFYAAREIWRYNNYLVQQDSTIINEKIKWPYSTNWDKDLTDAGKGAKVSAGFGLKGKRGTFDVSLDVLSWTQTTVTGPGAAMASFTYDFGRKNDE